MDYVNYEIDRVVFEAPDYVHDARHYLAMRGYSDIHVLAITAFLRRFGTVECCLAVRDEVDRAMLESFIPRAPEVEWLEHEPFVWALGPETNPLNTTAHP